MQDTTTEYPNIIPDGDDPARARVRGTGLTVWEIAWLSEVYKGNLDAIAENLVVERVLVEEGLCFGREHPSEIELALDSHRSYTLERLRREIPGLHVFSPVIDDVDQHP